MPKRWTIKEKNKKRKELTELYIDQNKTIKEVGEILGIKESSVFDRLKRLDVSTIPEKKPHFLNKKQGIIFPDLSDELAEFFGIMLGDGHLSHGQIWISINNNTDRGYRNYVKNLLKFLFGLEPGCCYRRKEDMKNLFLSSVQMVQFIP